MNLESDKLIPCTDIYCEEIENAINALKKFKEAWLKHSFKPSNELFRYGDDDFYFYRFSVEREEKSTRRLLDAILYRVMARYGIHFDIIDNVPFDFIINNESIRLGFSFEYIYEDDVASILSNYDICEAYVIRTERGNADEFMIRENERYRQKGVPLSIITIGEFFSRFLSEEEYEEFERHIEIFISKSKEIMGYQSIKFLSSMNLSARRAFEENILRDWNYEETKYQIIDTNNKAIQKKLYIADYNFGDIWKTICANYIDAGLYKTMVGCEDYAESFITSEWLYYSLKDKKNFDYTAIVSGYLKSVEQLLYKLTMLNINNGCVISLKGDKKKEAEKDGIIVYDMNNYKKTVVDSSCKNWPKYPYIDFTTTQKEYMDSSIGTFEFFIRNNTHIFIEPRLARVIGDMVSCFRTECRNGYFHTHNLHDSSHVDKTRENAIMLYAILIGSIKQSIIQKSKLGIIEEDKFDSICKEIREIRNYNHIFTFEYEDGTKKVMEYDCTSNAPEYTEFGVEHYERLVFYELRDFCVETYASSDFEYSDEWKVFLTRESLPKRIYCQDRKGIHEVSM